MQNVPQVLLGRPATYEDLVRVPDHLVAEIVDGELWTSPRPGPRHARAHTSLSAIIVPPYDHGRGGPGGWQVLIEPELHLGSDVLVPDLAGWQREHLPRPPETAFFPLAPDWVCEVLSPSTAFLDRAKKLWIYAREGVRHAWILDPIARTLEAFRLSQPDWLLVGTFSGQDHVRPEPFDALDVDLAVVWDDPERTTAGAPEHGSG
jgi:Uma2 family endonuclease